MTDRTQMNAYGPIPIGIKNGEVVYVSDAALAQKGLREIKEALDLTQLYAVKTSWSGHVAMVVLANSQAEATDIYMRARKQVK